MAKQILLVEDVESLGRAGQIVNVKPGYARNYLIPHGFGVIADKKALKFQEKVKVEREKKAHIDRTASEEIASKLEGITLTQVVKVDHDGHMYGSVTAHEILELLREHTTLEIEKKSIQLKQPIKATGVHIVTLKLKEGVVATVNLNVVSEQGYQASLQEVEQPKS